MSDPASDSSATPSEDSVFIPAFPFANAPDADAILRSSDGADFYIHRHILALVSPIFRDMFTLPQPETAPAIPSISLQENSAVLDRALRFFYPGVPQPTAMPLDELRDILEVLVSKYDMQCLVPAAKTQLESYIESQPVAVYAVAFNHQWMDIALKAAQQSLKIPLRVVDSKAPPELDHILASAYHNLLYYHTICAEKAKEITAGLRWVPAPNEFVWFSCTACAGAPLNWYLNDGVLYPVRIWFNQYLEALGGVLAQTPGIDLRQHKTMLDALAVASKCTVCRQKVFDQLPLFVSTQLAVKIKEVINEAQLTI
ncbi:hypothetical protein DFH06DRAFT_480162 [Mycena polygramma]|nr:hypothetical protein DFH06DRAFT_480162 [Mycena polygramma]